MEQRKEILSKILHSKKGTIFLPDSFAPIDTHYASNVLATLCNDGLIVRIAFGLYVRPEMTSLGPLLPSMQEIAQTIAKRDSAKILPTGPTAENFLGFSTQIPMNAVYLTSGSSRKIRIGKQTLTLKHSAPDTFAYKGKIMPILVLALKSIGKDDVDEDALDNVYGVLKQYPEEDTWQTDVLLAPRWIRKIITSTKERIKSNEQMD